MRVRHIDVPILLLASYVASDTFGLRLDLRRHHRWLMFGDDVNEQMLELLVDGGGVALCDAEDAAV